jgi:Mrp family chromosome partitioning ATPase
MARLLDQQSLSSRHDDPKENGVSTPMANGQESFEDHDNDGVPFIEVGAPDKRVAVKSVAKTGDRPATIPMLRTTSLPSAPPSNAPVTAFYQISFQPLPTRTWTGRPGEARIPPELVAYHQPLHEISLQYRSVLQEIEDLLPADSSRSLLFGSLRSGIGTTSVLLNLAITCAKQGRHRIAVVDANLGRPAVANRLGVAVAPGIREVLARTAPLMWTIQETAVSGLSAVAAGQRPEHPAIDLWPVLLDQLQQRFDWILIDGGEWNHAPEKPALLATSGATYLVLCQADLESAEANSVLTNISRQGGNLRGYILLQK